MPDPYLAGPSAYYGYAPPGQDTRLRGTGRLADDLWLLAHDDRTGKCRLKPRLLGLGLAGGRLAELLLTGQAGVTRDGLVVASEHAAPDPRAHHGLLRQTTAEPDLLPVRDWLRFISQSAGRAHHYLAILAVRADQQSRGTGAALLAAHHAVLDQQATPAYLAAASPRSRDLYLRHGYQIRPDGPIKLPDGPAMWPMWRQPRHAAAPAGGQEQA